jgi:hypothetical protein
VASWKLAVDAMTSGADSVEEAEPGPKRAKHLDERDGVSRKIDHLLNQGLSEILQEIKDGLSAANNPFLVAWAVVNGEKSVRFPVATVRRWQDQIDATAAAMKEALAATTEMPSELSSEAKYVPAAVGIMRGALAKTIPDWKVDKVVEDLVYGVQQHGGWEGMDLKKAMSRGDEPYARVVSTAWDLSRQVTEDFQDTKDETEVSHQEQEQVPASACKTSEAASIVAGSEPVTHDKAPWENAEEEHFKECCERARGLTSSEKQRKAFDEVVKAFQRTSTTERRLLEPEEAVRAATWTTGCYAIDKGAAKRGVLKRFSKNAWNTIINQLVRQVTAPQDQEGTTFEEILAERRRQGMDRKIKRKE